MPRTKKNSNKKNSGNKIDNINDYLDSDLIYNIKTLFKSGFGKFILYIIIFLFIFLFNILLSANKLSSFLALTAMEFCVLILIFLIYTYNVGKKDKDNE